MSRRKKILAILAVATALVVLFGCGSDKREDIRVYVYPTRAAMEGGGTLAFTAVVDGTGVQGATWETVPPTPWAAQEGEPQPPGTIVNYPGIYIDGAYIPPGTYRAPLTVPYPGVARVMARSAENSGIEGYAVIYVAMTLDGDSSVDLDADVEGLSASGDLLWRQISDTERSLEPVNGAQMVSMGGMGLADFDDIRRSDLAGLNYGFAALDGGDASAELVLGTVIAVVTSDGKYAKVQVYGYVALGDNARYYLKLIMYTFE